MRVSPVVMKSPLIAGTVALLGSSLIARADYSSFIRQYQQSSGIDWHMPVELQGEDLSPLTIEEGGALFQLWAINLDTWQDYLIDQKLVGAYLPKGEITIITQDPYQIVPRTRADQPFEVHFEVSGLLSGTNLPDAATKVLIEQYATPYPQESLTVTSEEALTLTRDQALTGDPIRSDYIDENGVTPQTFATTSLTGTDLTKVSGEEWFLMHVLPDLDALQTEIASAKIQIWPVASGRIDGLSNGETVRMQAPTLTVYLDDLYPSSSSYLQIYPGLPALGTVGTKISGSILILDQDKSVDRVLTVRSWQTTMQQEGTYTMELLTETPFGIDRLDYVTFTLDRTLKVRSMMTTSE